jgi:uncharacterized protein YkwD
VLLLAAACGPIYPQQQPQQQQPGPSQPMQGPPGANGGQWTDPNDPNGNAQPTAGDPWGNDPSRRPEPVDEPRPEPPPRVGPEPKPGPPPPPPPEDAKASTDSKVLLDAHNRYRAQHCAPPLTWSPKLEQFAQQWANKLKDDGCKFGHSGGRYGENLAAGTTKTLDGTSVTAMWYDEIKLYDFKSGGFSMETGHFTQVVWKASTQLGCAKTTCRGMDIWVCEYDPPGNVERGYRANVLPTSCK